MKRITLGISILFILLLSMQTLSAGEVKTPEEALRLSDLSRGNSEGLEWTIKIETEENNKKRKQTFKLFASGKNSLAEYKTPVKLKGRKILMKDRNMWFIKPGLSKPVAISPRQKLLGGASNGDIASTDYYGDYLIRESRDGEYNGTPCFILDLKAKNKKVTYDRITYWISKNRYIGVKADFYTISGKKLKTALFEYGNQITTDSGERPFISRMTITNEVMKKDVTLMTYLKIRIRKVPSSKFNLTLLVK